MHALYPADKLTLRSLFCIVITTALVRGASPLHEVCKTLIHILLCFAATHGTRARIKICIITLLVVCSFKGGYLRVIDDQCLITVVRAHFSIACRVRVWVSLTGKWIQVMHPFVSTARPWGLDSPRRWKTKEQKQLPEGIVSYILENSVVSARWWTILSIFLFDQTAINVNMWTKSNYKHIQ